MEKYADIINNKYSDPAAVIEYKDGRFRTLMINEKFLPELWMNVSEEAFINAAPEKSFDEENLKLFVDAVDKCVRTGQEQTVETWRSLFSDCCGVDKLCLMSRLVLIEKTPGEAYVFESVRNITNEKKAHDLFKDVESRYKQASEQINIYNWEYVIATKEMRPCYRCMRDLGLSAVVHNYPEPAIDMGIFPPDYADMYRDMMRRVDEGIPQIEADIPLTVGRVPFRVKYTTSFDDEGHPVKAFGSATLISETELGHIKLDNQIITTLAEEYRCIYLADFVADTVKIVKQDDTMSLAEGSDCKQLFDMLASKLQEITEKQRELLSEVRLVRQELFGDSDKREFVYKDESSEKWIRAEYQVIERGPLGIDRMIVLVSVIDDLRAQKMDAERLIAAQKKELEDRQKMLLSAVDEANRANKAKTEFFSNISHDIKTPMTAILGFSKLAMDEMDNRENLRDYLSRIGSAGDHLLELINDILDMSRLESGKMELRTEQVKLKELILDSSEMIRVKMDDKGIDFRVDVDGVGDDAVECDRLRFNQVILNLLSNAYKFTPSGGTVSLTGKLLTRADKLTYEIRVKDTGIGMSEEFREHIWDPYAREDSETVYKTQGTGLGMSIVGNIVNLMHGTIDVISAPDKGSEFIMEIPLDPVNADPDMKKDEKAQSAMSRNYKGRRILVVDDTSMNRRLAGVLLSRYGFSVMATDNGVDAVQRVADSEPGEIDLILMDVKMPVMNGLEATKRIRALEDPSLASIPVIAMTANAFESDIAMTRDAGMNDHIPKPFSPEELITAISRNLPVKT